MKKYNSITSKRELELGKMGYFKKIQENQEKILKSQYDRKILSINSEEKENFQKIVKIGIYISAILILLGFCLWYIKLQVYQDAILRRQATERCMQNLTFGSEARAGSAPPSGEN